MGREGRQGCKGGGNGGKGGLRPVCETPAVGAVGSTQGRAVTWVRGVLEKWEESWMAGSPSTCPNSFPL